MLGRLFVKLTDLPFEIQNLLLLIINSIFIIVLRAYLLATNKMFGDSVDPGVVLFGYSILSNAILLSSFLFFRLYKKFWGKKTIMLILIILQIVTIGLLTPVLFRTLGTYLFYVLVAG